jgi:hypothetical protein
MLPENMLVLLSEHKIFRSEVKMFDLSAVLSALICYASYIFFCVFGASSLGLTAVVGALWMIRSILSVWEKLAVCKKIAEQVSVENNELMRYDRGYGTWRIRTVFDILFFGGALLAAIRCFFIAVL